MRSARPGRCSPGMVRQRRSKARRRRPGGTPGDGARGARPGGTGLPVPRFVSLEADRVYLSRPGREYRSAGCWRKGLPVEIIAEFDTWRKVKLHDGDEGWIYASLLSSRRTAMIKNNIAEMRRRPADDARVVLRAEPGVIGELLDCTEDYDADIQGRAATCATPGGLAQREPLGSHPSGRTQTPSDRALPRPGTQTVRTTARKADQWYGRMAVDGWQRLSWPRRAASRLDAAQPTITSTRSISEPSGGGQAPDLDVLVGNVGERAGGLVEEVMVVRRVGVEIALAHVDHHLAQQSDAGELVQGVVDRERHRNAGGARFVEQLGGQVARPALEQQLGQRAKRWRVGRKRRLRRSSTPE